MEIPVKVQETLEKRGVDPNTFFKSVTIKSNKIKIIFRKGFDGYCRSELMYDNEEKIPLRGFLVLSNGDQIERPYISYDGGTGETWVDNVQNLTLYMFNLSYRYF
jgi:hypothetical protein